MDNSPSNPPKKLLPKLGLGLLKSLPDWALGDPTPKTTNEPITKAPSS